MNQSSTRRRIQQGFTLVEMAIVLAVIGLIIGAIAIAKDVQRNAEYAKIANKFTYQWKAAYDQYYQRAGVVVGDCQQSPTYMVDGQDTSFAGNATVCTRPGGLAAGIPENFAGTGQKICNGQGYAAGQTGAADHPLATNAISNLRALMTRVGVRLPPGRGEGMEDRYLYQDSNGNAAEIQICFQWNPPGTASGAGNVMVVRGLTPDLARFMDQLIDGKPDSREGRFRIQDRPAHTGVADANSPGSQWEANNTIASSIQASDLGTGTANPTAATATGRQFDEDRVVLLTAHWTMEE
jgi:prepilin-type N-terminal cleavage/methylation domain-containing protein